jgi:hypothetical protein
MNSSGQYNQLTAEFWIQIQSFAVEPRKIFGPIASLDGLYVEGSFIKLKIGRQVVSHFVSEWDRPMLVDIRLSPEETTLIVNGESVASMELNPLRYRFPEKIKDNMQQDWLGFYAYEDVPRLRIDCFGIYPYEVAALVAKRRWVYGQGVETPTDIKGLDSSSSVFIDYPFAKYSKNFSFPTSSNWSNGSLENLVDDRRVLRPPRHQMPEISFDNREVEDWQRDLESIQTQEKQVIKLKPNNDWSNTEGHLFYENLNFLEQPTTSFYGVFESETISLDKRVLFELVNSRTEERLEIYYKGNPVTALENETVKTKQDDVLVTVSGKRHGLKTGMKVLISGTARVPQGFYEVFVISNTEFSYTVSENLADAVEEQEDENFVYSYDSTIYYEFFKPRPERNIENVEETTVAAPSQKKIFYTAPGHQVGKRFMVGLHLPRFTAAQKEELASFFGSRQNISIFIGGSRELSNTFEGNIYRVGFATQRNLSKINHLFNDVGIPVDYENVFDHFGPTIWDAGDKYFGNDPDYWEHALDGGDPYDFQAIKAIEHVATYTLVPKLSMGMSSLDIAINGFWEDYVPLSFFAKQKRNVFGRLEFTVSFLQINLDYPEIKKFNNLGEYDTSKNSVRAYVAFQYLRNGSNAIEDNFTDKKLLGKDKVITPDSNWMNTKYEVVDGTILYPPEDVDYRSLSVNLYLEYNIDGINSNPVNSRSLQISSQALGNSPNRIGTRFGQEIVPFTKVGQYFDYKKVAPFAIYKSSTPYLYNTSNSGMEIREKYSNRGDFGISVPLNSSASPFFKIGSFQMFLKYGEDLFPEIPVKIFEIESSREYVQFFLAADSKNKKRGQIYALDANTGNLKSGLVFFNNGAPVKRPVLYSNVWNVVGVSFPGFLELGQSPSALRITSPIMFNNFSFYQTTASDDEERFGFRQWFGVRSFLGEPLDWSYWAGLGGGEQFTWRDVLFLSTTLREELDGEKIYNIYTGTDRSISTSDQLFSLKDYEYKVYRNLSWLQNTVSGV